MRPVDVLIRAREIIALGHRWTTGAPARDSRDRPTQASDSDASSFCAIGALRRVAFLETGVDSLGPERGEGPFWGAYHLIDCYAADVFGMPATVGSVGTYNDCYGHEAVLEMYDAAIEAALPGEKEIITVEPLEVPEKAPQEAPAEPVKTPEKEPEKVPA